MQKIARSVFSDEPDSREAGLFAAKALVAELGCAPKAVIVYATINHEQLDVVQGVREGIGKDALLIGCSVQGVVSNATVTEDGYALGLMGFGGADVQCAVALEREVQTSPREKGRRLAQSLKRDLKGEPKAVLVLYDPLAGIDVEAVLEGMRLEVDCPLVGGAAGQPWGPPRQTFQYLDGEVLSHGVVALGLSGPFAVEVGICHGTSPTGIASVVTKAEGNHVLEIDGRRAVDVWRETTGCKEEEMIHQSHLAAWAVGVEVKGHAGQADSVIRGAFGFAPDTGAVILQAAVPEGTRIMLHHRTVEQVMSGTQAMGRELAIRLSGRKPWAVLGFECAARTYPFLGEANTNSEHQELRSTVAPDSPWLGMMAWGEIGPSGGRPAFHNYTYPLLLLVD
ncbi:MAG: FIST N-terminal domain-containing protein [Polyangiaceae bacterium]